MMLREIMGTQCADRALLAQVTVFTSSARRCICVSDVSCRNFHENACLQPLLGCYDWITRMYAGAQ
jgi:hypothetical protein